MRIVIKGLFPLSLNIFNLIKEFTVSVLNLGPDLGYKHYITIL